MTQTTGQNEMKQLNEWAKENLTNQASRFLQYCKEEGHEATDVISYSQFLILQEKFES